MTTLSDIVALLPAEYRELASSQYEAMVRGEAVEAERSLDAPLSDDDVIVGKELMPFGAGVDPVTLADLRREAAHFAARVAADRDLALARRAPSLWDLRQPDPERALHDRILRVHAPRIDAARRLCAEADDVAQVAADLGGDCGIVV